MVFFLALRQYLQAQEIVVPTAVVSILTGRRDRETERQRDRETERQGDRDSEKDGLGFVRGEGGRQREQCRTLWCRRLLCPS